LSKLAIANDISVWDIHDFGFTQIAPDSLTCIAIGPDVDEKIDIVIKDLKLL
jgi:peptidyl-tRNA hydrolase